MARLLLLCLLLCHSSATTAAARRLLMSPTGSVTSGRSTVANMPSPSMPESGGYFAGEALSSSAPEDREDCISRSPATIEPEKNIVGGAPSTVEASESGQQSTGRRSSSYPVGGDVILGGLATAFLAVIVCYIRVTRRRDEEEEA